MGNSVGNKPIGLLFKRNNLINLRIKDFVQELHIYLFELTIVYKSIMHLKKRKLTSFDSLVGDRKCQTRTAMILSLLYKKSFVEDELVVVEDQIEQLLQKTKSYIEQIAGYSHFELQTLTKNLLKFSLLDYFNSYNLNYDLSNNLKLASLCFLTAMSKEELKQLCSQKISSNKLDRLLVSSKITLCNLSIKYEQELAKIYGCINEQKVLAKVETKSFCSMTATLPNIKHILKKAKKENQFLLKKIIKFCVCGGAKLKNIKSFIVHHGEFIQKSIEQVNKDKVVMVIEGYQYPGSFKQLKERLGISKEATSIPLHFHRICMCSNNGQLELVDDIENAVIASLTQHPQFTTSIDINFEELALENSCVQEEYNYYKKLSGFSREDMSRFFVTHIYPSTVKEVLESDKEFMIEPPKALKPKSIRVQPATGLATSLKNA